MFQNRRTRPVRNKQMNMAAYAVAVPMDCRLYLKVPFEDKDKAKSLGARFDPDQKKWYADTRKPMLGFKPWLVDVGNDSMIIARAEIARRKAMRDTQQFTGQIPVDRCTQFANMCAT